MEYAADKSRKIGRWSMMQSYVESNNDAMNKDQTEPRKRMILNC